ncbi:acetyl-CoA carboxylase carboxyl transferase subunit [Jiangella alkaliphila]|uniref:Multifunctional fusion protein n=1 Tax=Jiangella alkaliphila TaxID=419479 RepID=A0A1H2I624_9ACTN|nr:acetyl-CoA carboxylase carboxyl transferase subunit [Jiangella alkaliphila]SDU39561.1 acetyl-CoA carboxylase carboxyl transferase subunit beta [Jiangella alkaliphila]
MTETVKETASDGRVWSRCPSCSTYLYAKRLDRNSKVCPECGHHLRLTLDERLAQLLDPGSLAPFAPVFVDADPLGFVDSRPYPQRLEAARRKTGRPEAVVAGTARIGGEQLVVAALDFAFMGGSIGTAVGDVLVVAAEEALRRRLPLLIISASGGARMQEGCLSLMQLARTAQEIAKLREAGVLVINLNTDATFGGATASFSSLGDIIMAEPGSLIGFAGPQVIRQTVREELPAGFQTAEFLFEHGMVDIVVPRQNLRETTARLLRAHRPASSLHSVGGGHAGAAPERTAHPEPERGAVDPWEVVTLARNVGRPTTLDYIAQICDDFVELHGDRTHADDAAIVGGIAQFQGRAVVVVGHQKGHDTAEMVRRNFGMPHPEGYRKAMRLMQHADRFGLPLLTLVDTAGAYPGLQAEARGQGGAIAECIAAMSRLRVPVVSVVTGEGGSGGALALAVGNVVLMLENSYYSVISPEGCSTILWGTAAKASTAAAALRLTAPDLLDLGIVDGVVDEPAGGAHTDPSATADNLARALGAALAQLSRLSPDELVADRYSRFRAFGQLDDAIGAGRRGAA